MLLRINWVRLRSSHYSDCGSQTDYMSLVISAYLGGTVSEIKTLTCWTDEELVVYSKKAQSVYYLPPKR